MIQTALSAYENSNNSKFYLSSYIEDPLDTEEYNIPPLIYSKVVISGSTKKSAIEYCSTCFRYIESNLVECNKKARNFVSELVWVPRFWDDIILDLVQERLLIQPKEYVCSISASIWHTEPHTEELKHWRLISTKRIESYYLVKFLSRGIGQRLTELGKMDLPTIPCHGSHCKTLLKEHQKKLDVIQTRIYKSFRLLYRRALELCLKMKPQLGITPLGTHFITAPPPVILHQPTDVSVTAVTTSPDPVTAITANTEEILLGDPEPVISDYFPGTSLGMPPRKRQKFLSDDVDN